MSGDRGQAGSAALPALVLVVVAAGLVAGLSRTSDAAHAAARADAVADVTALAGATAGRAGAERVAVASGAELVDHREDLDRVLVAVRRGGIVRVAAATSVSAVGEGRRDHGGS